MPPSMVSLWAPLPDLPQAQGTIISRYNLSDEFAEVNPEAVVQPEGTR